MEDLLPILAWNWRESDVEEGGEEAGKDGTMGLSGSGGWRCCLTGGHKLAMLACSDSMEGLECKVKIGADNMLC